MTDISWETVERALREERERACVNIASIQQECERRVLYLREEHARELLLNKQMYDEEVQRLRRVIRVFCGEGT